MTVRCSRVSAVMLVLACCGSTSAQEDVGALVFGIQNRVPQGALEDAAKRYGYDELVRALCEDDIEHQYYVHPRSGGGSPNSRFHLMLRDWRVAKLRSYLHAKPKEEQAAAAEQLFDTCIEAYDDGFQNTLAMLRGQKFVKKPFDSRHDATLTMLLMCAEFCEPESVLQKVDYYKEVVAKHDREQSADDKVNQIGIGGLVRRPDAAFLNNLYLYLLEQRFPEAFVDADLKMSLFGVGRNLLTPMPILQWDLKANKPGKANPLRPTCRLLPEFEGMGHDEMQARREKQIRAVVDKYVAQSTPPAK